MVTGTRQQVTKFNNATAVSPAFQFARTSVSRPTSIRVLGVTIDQHLTSDNQFIKIIQSCNYHTRLAPHSSTDRQRYGQNSIVLDRELPT